MTTISAVNPWPCLGLGQNLWPWPCGCQALALSAKAWVEKMVFKLLVFYGFLKNQKTTKGRIFWFFMVF